MLKLLKRLWAMFLSKTLDGARDALVVDAIINGGLNGSTHAISCEGVAYSIIVQRMEGKTPAEVLIERQETIEYLACLLKRAYVQLCILYHETPKSLCRLSSDEEQVVEMLLGDLTSALSAKKD